MQTKVLHNQVYFIVNIDCWGKNFFSKLHKWLDEHTTGHWTTSSAFVGFKKKEDAMFFILAWKDGS